MPDDLLQEYMLKREHDKIAAHASQLAANTNSIATVKTITDTESEATFNITGLQIEDGHLIINFEEVV